MELFYFVEEYDYLYHITVQFPALDRDTNHKVIITFSQSYFKDSFSKHEATRLTLKNALAHEIDECLYLNDQRIFDPHLKENANVF